MNKTNPKRIAIIGLPGSGKSTLAIALGKLLDIPVHHLDTVIFDPKGKKIEKEGLNVIQQKMVDQDSWIIEGCSISTLEKRFIRANTILYLRFPRLLCLWRIFKRQFSSDNLINKSGCLQRPNWQLLKYIWTFESEKWESIEQLAKQYPNVDFRIFTTPKEVEVYIQQYQQLKK